VFLALSAHPHPHSHATHGYLVLADLSSYTAFLASGEPGHAHAISADLLELITARLRTVFPVTQLEGGAVFAHAPEAQLSRGEMLLETLEATYAAFRDHLAAIRRRTTCECTACRNLSRLDLKFLAHHGDYIAHTIDGHWDFMGLDVALVRERLLKTAGGDSPGYLVLTEACLAHMDVRPAGLQERSVAYEPWGEVKTYCLDLSGRYQQRVDARRVVVEAADAHAVYRHDFAAPPATVWDWLNDPFKRTRWMEFKWTALDRPAGRTGVGARNHCAHGGGATIETILDWRPFDYYTSAYVLFKLPLTLLMTYRLEPLPPAGSRLHLYVKFPVPVPRWLTRLTLQPALARTYALMAALMADDLKVSEE